jgi:hypothetical protein
MQPELSDRDRADPLMHPGFLRAIRAVDQAALGADEPGMIRATSEWMALVEKYTPELKVASFTEEALGPLFAEAPSIVAEATEPTLTEDELNFWAALVMDVWNNTPQRDRDWQTPLELFGPDRRSAVRRRRGRRRRHS